MINILELESSLVYCIHSILGRLFKAIKENKIELLFKRNDKNLLKNTFKNMIEDANLRAKFSANARTFIVENFSIKTMVEQTENMYETL